ncbi:MAG: tetratricopeptide repeat protein [Endozoicomonas sp.]
MPDFLPVLRQTTLLLLVMALTGCAGQPVTPEAESGEYVLPTKDRQGAMGSLLVDAIQAMESGRLEEAGHSLSRALRINPTEPSIYFYMAELRKRLGDHDQALQLAGRALSLEPDPALKVAIEILIHSLKS